MSNTLCLRSGDAVEIFFSQMVRRPYFGPTCTRVQRLKAPKTLVNTKFNMKIKQLQICITTNTEWYTYLGHQQSDQNWVLLIFYSHTWLTDQTVQFTSGMWSRKFIDTSWYIINNTIYMISISWCIAGNFVHPDPCPTATMCSGSPNCPASRYWGRGKGNTGAINGHFGHKEL